MPASCSDKHTQRSQLQLRALIDLKMPPTKPKGGKMMSLINYRLRITLNDSRQIVGQLLAFDAHMNLVLADSQEYRKIKSRKAKARAAAAAKAGTAGVQDDDDEDDVGASSSAPDAIQEQKRTLGLLILRGENIVSMAIEAPPPADDRKQPTVSTAAKHSSIAVKCSSFAPSHTQTISFCLLIRTQSSYLLTFD